MPYVARLNRHRWNVLALAVIAALPVVPWGSATAQVQIQIDEESGLPTDTGVYVRDSAIVSERVALADRMERSKEWAKAADILQEIIEKHGQRIVPVPVGDTNVKGVNGLRRYIGATDLVQRRLAQWPADGLTAYDARFGHVAQQLIDADPFDDATLGRIDSEYFITDAGKIAGIRRIDLALEAGEFGSAAWMADRLLVNHPRLGDDRAGVLFRLGVARHLAGEEKAAAAALEELRTKHADAKLVVAGQPVSPADALASVLKEPVSTAAEVATNSWPTLGGGPSRGRVPNIIAKPGARFANIALSRPNLRGLPTDRRRVYQRQTNSRDLGSGVMPVVDRGELFFNDGQRLYGVTLDDGRPLPGWVSTYPDESQRGQFSLPANATVGGTGGRQLNTTVSDDAVVAIMGQGDRALAQGVGRVIEPRLVCVDRKTGKQRWVVKPADLPDETLKSMSFGGSPLVVEGNVYITGRATKQANFEDCYVLCFDLETGKQKWACYVSGASAMAMWNDGIGPVASDNDAHVSFAGGRLFVSTNLGAVASIDAYSGAVQWLTTYARGNANADMRAGPVFNRRMAMMNSQFGGSTAQVSPWAYNPPVVRDGRVFVLPVDGQNLFVFDAGSGDLLKMIEGRHFNNLDTFVGLWNDTIVFAGNVTSRGPGGAQPSQNASLIGINWRTYDAGKFRVTRFPEQPDPSVTCATDIGGGGPLRGRPFLTASDVFIPTEKRLWRFAIEQNKMLDEGTYPAYPAQWDKSDPDGEAPGNVLVSGDHVVLASAYRVDIYTDRQLAMQKLNESEAANPNDPEPRLDYSHKMFESGDIPLALRKLDEAANLMGGLDNLTVGPLRERLFQDALNRAVKMAQAVRPGGQAALTARQQASDFFDRAAAAAYTPDQQVSWRLARSKLFESGREFPNAVRMHQEILSDAKLRAVPRVDERDGPVAAAAIAEKRINEIINAAGTRQPYISYELVAEEKVRAAREKKDSAALLELAQTYPNANVVTRALVAAAEVYEDNNDPRMAVHVLRQAMRRGGATRAEADPNRAAVVEAIARNYLKLPGGVDSAIARLSKIARLDSDPTLSRPMTFADGTEVQGKTYMTALAALRKASATDSAEARLPDIKLTPRAEFEVDPATGRKRFKKAFLPVQASETIDGIAQFVVPMEEMSRNDRVIGWTGKALNIYTAGGDVKPLASFEQVTSAPLGAAWMENELVVWSSSTLWRFAPESGQLLWSVAIDSLPTLPALPAEMAGDDEDELIAEGMMDGVEAFPPGMPPNIAMRRGFGNRGRIVVGANGRVMNPANADPMAVTDTAGPEQIIDVRPTATRVVMLTSSGRLAGFDAKTGQAGWQVRIADRGAQRMVATDEFTVARSTDETGTSTLLVVDTFWGNVLARPRFPIATGAPLTNFAVSRQGVLVYTQTDRLATKDLFESWEGNPPNERMAESGQGGAVFTGAGAEEQLIVGDGLAAALSGGGMVRVYSLLAQLTSVQQLTTGGGDWDASLRMIGSQLYTVSSRAYRTYDLNNPSADGAPPSIEIADRPPTIRGALYTKGHVILLDTMGQGGDPAAGVELPNSTTYRLWAISRDRVNGVESAMIDYFDKLPVERAGITKWQAVDGGLYYHTQDGKLKFMRGGGSD